MSATTAPPAAVRRADHNELQRQLCAACGHQVLPVDLPGGRTIAVEVRELSLDGADDGLPVHVAVDAYGYARTVTHRDALTQGEALHALHGCPS